MPVNETTGDRKLKLTDQDVEAMIDAAFETLAKRHPEATSGDFPPDASGTLFQQMQMFAEYWLELNTPKNDNA